MWNFHFCFNRRLTCCNRTSFPGITDLHLARPRMRGTRKDGFCENSQQSLSPHLPQAHRRRVIELFMMNSSESGLHLQLLFFFSLDPLSLSNSFIFNLPLSLYLPLSDLHLSFLYSSRSSFSNFFLFVIFSIRRYPWDATFGSSSLLGITVKTFDV